MQYIHLVTFGVLFFKIVSLLILVLTHVYGAPILCHIVPLGPRQPWGFRNNYMTKTKLFLNFLVYLHMKKHYLFKSS
jgi:hypothetical protein